MAQKLHAGGVPLRPAQHPKTVTTSKPQPPQKTDKRSNLAAIIESLKVGKITVRQAQLWLERQDDYYDERYRARHMSVGVGAEAEKRLEWLSQTRSDGKVTEERVEDTCGQIRER